MGLSEEDLPCCNYYIQGGARGAEPPNSEISPSKIRYHHHITRCQILRLKCTKFDFGWGSAPDPTVGAYSALQTP